MSTAITGPTFKPGIYFDIPAEEYHAAPGLSHSGMKDLMVSPLRYWYLHINPNRPQDKQTPEMKFGTALHCSVLEPEQFRKRYACEVTEEDFPGCLVTMDHLKAWLRDRSISTTAKLKSELVQRVLDYDPEAPILDVLLALHAEKTCGMELLDKDSWYRASGATEALMEEPAIKEILQSGNAEVSIFAVDPETGVLLKARMDWVSPSCTLDLKTFTQMRGRSIDDSVARAIFYEGYYRQAYFYTLLRSLAGSKVSRFVFGFVESDQPHEVRIRQLSEKGHGEAHAYWERARLDWLDTECRGCVRGTDYPKWSIQGESGTLREAIDAARKEAK